MSGWTGFAPLTLAEKAGIFKKNGVDASIKFIPQKDRPLAIAAGILAATAVLAFWLRDDQTTAHTPTITVESEEDVALGVQETAVLVPPPPPPAPAPVRPVGPITIHAVLIKTYPNGALVTVNGRSFGTTPTYAKVPAFVPVELRVTKAGYPTIVHKLTSKTTTDRVFLKLRRR
jgi:hypothetical protein